MKNKTLVAGLLAVGFGWFAWAGPTLSVLSEEKSGGVLTAVNLAVSGYDEGYYQILSCYGFSEGDDDSTNGWETVETVATISSNVDSLRVPVPVKWDNQVRHLRFMLCSIGVQYLDYIQSTDGKPTVALDVTPTPSMIFEMKFRYTNYGGGSFLGYKPGKDTEDWRVFRYSNDFYYDVPGGSDSGIRIHSGTHPSTSQVCVYEIGNYYASDLTDPANPKNRFVSGDVQNYTVGGPINLFAEKDYGILYYLKVWDGEKDDEHLIRNFVPAMQDGEVGLFDQVYGGFYPNTGSGSLVYGEIVSGGTSEVLGATDQFNSEKTLADPVAEIVSVASTGATSVGGKLDITWLGQVSGVDASACSFTVKYTNFLPTLAGSAELVDATGAGEYDFSITGLAPGGSYTAQLYADNGSGEIALGEPFTFNTPASIGGTAPQYVGLWSRRVSSSWDGGNTAWDRDVMGSSVGTGDGNRRRERGMMAAYAVNDGAWDVLDPVGTTSNWRGDSVCTICYVGYMWFDAGTVYKFQANNDNNHNAYVLIDPETDGAITRTFVESEMWMSAIGKGQTTIDFVTDKSGWHAVKLVKGRLYGFSGDTHGDGFLFSSDGGANWKKIIDPCDGSFLRVNCTEMLELTAVSHVGEDMRGTLAADALIAGWELYACMATEFKGTDFTAWTTETLGDAVATDGESRDFAVALADGAKYFRLAAVKRGDGGAIETVCWSTTVAIDELSTIDATRPVAELRSVSSEASDGAELLVNVVNCGLQSTCDLIVVMDAEGENPSVTNRFSAVTQGSRTVRVTGLAPNRTYAVTVTPVAGEAEGDVSAPLAFTTDDELGVRLPGLWQARNAESHGGTLQFGVDVMSAVPGTAVGQRTRQLGPTAAFYMFKGGADEGKWANPFDLDTTSGWIGNDTFGYEGFVYLNQGEYQFNYHVDDGVLLVIDGQELCRTTDNGNYTVTYACNERGWYPIHIELADGAGWAGGNDGADSFRYNYNKTGWKQFIDPGDGSLFRCASNGDLPVAGYAVSGGRFAAMLVSAMPGISSYKLASGNAVEVASDDWTNLDDATVVGLSVSAAADDVRYFRLYGFNADGVEVAASDVFYVGYEGVPQLSVASEADGSSGNALTFAFDVISLGAGDTADVKVMLSASPDMSGAVAVADEAVSACGPVALEVSEGIVPGTMYYYQVVLTGTDGQQDVMPATPVEARGASRLGGTMSASANLWNGTFNGTLEYLGCNDTYVYLMTGASADSLTNTAMQAVTEEGAFRFDVEFPFLGQKVAYAFVVSNACGTTSWTAQGTVASVNLPAWDKFYWNPTVKEGDWSDPSSWADSDGQPLDPRCGYPNSGSTEVKFSRCAGNGHYVIHVDGEYSVKEINASAAVDIELVEKGTGAKISANGVDHGMNLPEGSVFASRGVDLILRYFEPKKDGVYVFDGCRLEESAKYGQGNSCQVSFINGATFYLSESYADNVSMSAENAVLELDDSTMDIGNSRVFYVANSNSALTNQVVFAGAAPKLKIANVFSGFKDKTGGNGAEFVLSVPPGGYTAPIIDHYLNGSYWDHPLSCSSHDESRKTLTFRVAKDSPAFKEGGSCDMLLVEWQHGINVDRVQLAPSPRDGRSQLYYTYGWEDGHTTERTTPNGDELPTGIRLSVKNTGFAIIVR